MSSTKIDDRKKWAPTFSNHSTGLVKGRTSRGKTIRWNPHKADPKPFSRPDTTLFFLATPLLSDSIEIPCSAGQLGAPKGNHFSGGPHVWSMINRKSWGTRVLTIR